MKLNKSVLLFFTVALFAQVGIAGVMQTEGDKNTYLRERI